MLAQAHSINVPIAGLVIHRDGTFTVDANFDLPAYVLNDTPARIGDEAMNAWMDGDDATIASGLADAQKRLQHGIVFTSGGSEFRGELSGFIGVNEVHAWRTSGIKPRLPMMAPATLRGKLPPGATSITIRFPEALGQVLLTIEQPAEEPVSQSLEAGEASEPIAIHLPPAIAPIIAAPIVAAAPPSQVPAVATNSGSPAAPVVIVSVVLLIFSAALYQARRMLLRHHA